MSAALDTARALARSGTGDHSGDLEQLVRTVVRTRAQFAVDRVLLVGISGIDGSGKSHLTERLAEALQRWRMNVAAIGIDPWQHPQRVRLASSDPGPHFFANAIRWADLFDRLVRPLVRDRSIDIVETVIRTDVDRHFPKQYRFTDVDVVLLEGIFLFRNELAARFDLRIWIECSFETALARALSRNQEGLSASEVVRDYSSIYFPAQRLHFERDGPRARAHLTFDNDAVTARGVGA